MDKPLWAPAQEEDSLGAAAAAGGHGAFATSVGQPVREEGAGA